MKEFILKNLINEKNNVSFISCYIYKFELLFAIHIKLKKKFMIKKILMILIIISSNMCYSSQQTGLLLFNVSLLTTLKIIMRKTILILLIFCISNIGHAKQSKNEINFFLPFFIISGGTILFDIASSKTPVSKNPVIEEYNCHFDMPEDFYKTRKFEKKPIIKYSIKIC